MFGGGQAREAARRADPVESDPETPLCPDGGVPGASLFEAVPDPVVGYVREDGGFRATGANEAFRDVFEPDEPVAGRDLAAVLVTGGEGSFLDGLGGDAPRAVVTHPDEADREFLLRAVPADGEGQRAGYAVYTDAAGYDERIEELKARLDRFDRLVSVVVHDLRNPLEVAGIRLEAARETGEAEHFEKIATAHERIADLVEELQETARDWDEIGETEVLDLEEAVEAAWDGVATGDGTLETVGTLGDLRADPGRLRRLLENLFHNAVEHGSTGPSTEDEVSVRVGTIGDVEGFYVEDDGPGIPPENREEVFEAGFSTREGGTGLGLAIVAGIADAHGWSVNVTESDAGGARFEITAGGTSGASPGA